MRFFLPLLFVLLTSAGVGSFSVTDTIYFRDLGHSLAFIGLMVGVFNICVAVSELPFAILFDRYSSKLSILIGVCLRIAAFALFAVFFMDQDMLLMGQALAGIATAATSGTVVALVMNEVRERSYEAMSLQGSRISLVAGVGSLIGGTLGSVGYTYYPQTIWLLAIGFFCFALGALARFRDTPVAGSSLSLQDMALCVLSLIKQRCTVLLVLNNACALAPILLWQLKFNAISPSAVLAGFAVVSLSKIAGSVLFRAFKADIAFVKYACLVNVIAIGAFVASTDAYVMLLLFAVHVLVHIVQSICLEGLFQSQVANAVRASSLSLVSLLDSLVVALLAPVVGLLAARYGFMEAAAVSCVLYAVVAGLSAGVREETPA